MDHSIKKTDRRIRRTKASIRDAFIGLLSDKDLAQITVKELSERANINRKTFYMYYANIHDILDKLEDELIDTLLTILKGSNFFDANFDVYAFFLSLNSIIEQDLDLYKRLVYANSHTQLFVKLKEIIKTSLLDSYNENFNISKSMFQLYAEYAATGIMSVYIEWLTMDSPLTLEELAKAAGDITLHGFSPLVVK